MGRDRRRRLLDARDRSHRGHVLSAVFVPWLLCMLWILLVSLRLGLTRSGGQVPASSIPAPANHRGISAPHRPPREFDVLRGVACG